MLTSQGDTGIDVRECAAALSLNFESLLMGIHICDRPAQRSHRWIVLKRTRILLITSRSAEGVDSLSLRSVSALELAVMYSIFHRPQSKSDIPNLVYPRIENTTDQESIAAQRAATKIGLPILEPLAGDLVISYTLGWETSDYIDHELLEKYKLQKRHLRHLAEANAITKIGKLKIRRDGAVCQLSAANNMASCSALFSKLWEQTEKAMDGPIIAAFPHRNVVLYARADLPEAIPMLSQAIERTCFPQIELLSRLLYHRIQGVWVPIILEK